MSELTDIINEIAPSSSKPEKLKELVKELNSKMDPLLKDVVATAKRALRYFAGSPQGDVLRNWLTEAKERNHDRYSSHLYSESDLSPLRVQAVAPEYDEENPVDARIILRENFDRILSENPAVVIFGEDTGKIGDVNQGLEGLQKKHGKHRVYDTGIREATIMGQGIGLAMRGVRPITEIQYLDYLLYALQTMSDDLATLRYRTKARQKAPVIVRTRGHRLEGIWHSGSPMGMILGSLRGIHVLVPRNMTQAAGFYNTLLESDDPALVIECLNGYRLKENMPSNLAEIRTPLGVPEVIQDGTDVTLVTYGSCCRIATDAAKQLEEFGISLQVIDVQSLMPFDRHHMIVEELKDTNRLVVLDEDVPGGASAFILQKILEEQNGYQYLDSKPVTITSHAHRPAYGSDGDYFSKPNVEDVFEIVYNMMHEADPSRFPAL